MQLTTPRLSLQPLSATDAAELFHIRGEVGFMIASAKWGQGLAKEALQALVGFAVLQPLHTLTARIQSANSRCEQLLLNAGFQPTASVPDFEIRPGVFRHCQYFRYDLSTGKSGRI